MLYCETCGQPMRRGWCAQHPVEPPKPVAKPAEKPAKKAAKKAK